LAIGEFLWFLMLAWPGDTFGRPTYAVMAHVMPEEAWALVLLVSATIQLTIVVTETYHSYGARVFAAWNALLWIFLVVSMLMSVYPPPAAIGGEVALACAALWIWVRPAFLMRVYSRAFRATKQ
jgi:hypothetical protein